MVTKRVLSVGATVFAALMMAANGAARAAPDPSPGPMRVVPVTEETAAPGVADDVYEPCSSVNLANWTKATITETNECAAKTSYRWASSSLPTPTERREMCSCTLLIDKLAILAVPRCTRVVNNRTITYTQLITYVFAMCQVKGTPTSAPTTPPSTQPSTPTLAPTASSSAPSNPSSLPPSSTSANTDETSTATSQSKVPLISGIGGAIVAIIIVVVAVFHCRKRNQATKAKHDDVHDANNTVDAMPLILADSESAQPYARMPKTAPIQDSNFEDGTQSTLYTTGSASTQQTSEVVSAWDDPAITAMRIAYDSIFFGALINRGGYGEVYRGTYKGEQVAIKQLLPERRKDLVQIDAFIREIKLLSTLDHERIVRCIGIAWNALSDVCAVVEYMPNGDLRTMLTKWEYQDARPRGFDADKAKIALHVAHALTYLHSCQPVIVHRDLKSRNIVLSENYDAKLTDFGESRERADTTMTAGVGTSLWMAPEVMLGERYNEKADVFSFGVVLAELDTHELPYSHAMDAMTGRKLIDSAILQQVSLGRLKIRFSIGAHKEIAQLGMECVALDPTQRPTSGEVLHRVHQVWRQLSS